MNIDAKLDELEQRNDPLIGCRCYALGQPKPELYVVLCLTHSHVVSELKGTRRYKYEQWFRTEELASAAIKVIYDRWHPDGYSTIATKHQIGKFWLVLAWWADSCD